MSFFNELRRRNVFKIAAAYTIAGWLIMQAGDVLGPALHLPDWVSSLLAFFLLLGFPIALVLAWAFELTPDGFRKEKEADQEQPINREAGLRLNRMIIIVLALALVYFMFDKIVLDPKRDAELVKGNQSAAEQTSNKTEPDVLPDQPEQPDKNSIAVLPFLNMSSDPEQEYFSDGITEEVLNLLVKIPELKVTSRSSVFSFKGQNPDIPTVAKKLGVAHILEGSVRKAGNRVRVTAQLIEAGKDVHLWSETYERQLDDIFLIQDEIAREVVKALQIQLLGEAPIAVATNVEAYQLYLRGKHLATLATRKSYEAATTTFRQAIALDANFAPPFVGLANVLRYQGQRGFIELSKAMEAARQAVSRALELDNELAEAWVTLATIQLYYDWNWVGAKETIDTALQYGPQNAYVLRQATWVYLTLGEMQQALEFARLAVELDPLDYNTLANYGTTYWALVQPKDEGQVYRQILELYPNSVSVKSWLASALAVQGRPEEGMQYLDFDSENVWQLTMSSIVLHELGRHKEEQLIRQRMIDENNHIWAFRIALSYAWHGDVDQAFKWLNTAYEQKDGFIVQLVFNPWLRPLHDDPRWQEMIERMGLQKYWSKLQARKVQADS